VRALAIGYFFLVAALAGLAVGMAYRLQTRYRQRWLSPYALFLVSWGAFGLLSVVQYILAWEFLPHSVWNQLQVITRPPESLAIAASVITLVFKVGMMYGSIARALMAIRQIDDPLERAGLRRFVLLQLGGFVAFDLAVRDVTSLVGVHTPDTVIALAQVCGTYPALWWLAIFLRRRAVARPAEPLPADLKSELVALGLSARESDVIDLPLLGLGQKEVAERLFISPDTSKKHTCNAYRKLGVRNRVQLTCFVQNRVARRG